MSEACAHSECDDLVVSRSLCESHYRRQLTHGSPDAGGTAKPHNKPGKRFGQLVLIAYLSHLRKWSVECDCGTRRTIYIRSLTQSGQTHCADWSRHPHPGLSERPTYGAVHKRLVSVRGSACERSCVDCGKSASQWSYLNDGGLNELSSESGCRYSPDISKYEPRCRKCHRIFDRDHRSPGRLYTS